jgi:glucan biosynthesis protein C
MFEALLLNPEFFTLYYMTPHGFFLGMVCFIIGFIFISLKEVFWQAAEELRRGALILAFLLYLVRLLVLPGETNLLISIESMSLVSESHFPRKIFFVLLFISEIFGSIRWT